MDKGKEFIEYVRKNVQVCLILDREWRKSAHPGYNAQTVGELINEEIENDFQLPKYRTKPEDVVSDIEATYQAAFEVDELKDNKKLKESYELFTDSQEHINWEEDVMIY
jgi:hypothetical protein